MNYMTGNTITSTYPATVLVSNRGFIMIISLRVIRTLIDESSPRSASCYSTNTLHRIYLESTHRLRCKTREKFSHTHSQSVFNLFETGRNSKSMSLANLYISPIGDIGNLAIPDKARGRSRHTEQLDRNLKDTLDIKCWGKFQRRRRDDGTAGRRLKQDRLGGRTGSISDSLAGLEDEAVLGLAGEWDTKLDKLDEDVGEFLEESIAVLGIAVNVLLELLVLDEGDVGGQHHQGLGRLVSVLGRAVPLSPVPLLVG